MILRLHIGQILPLLACMMLVSCGVSEPSAEVWSDVSSFSWPATAAVKMSYRVEKISWGNVENAAINNLTTQVSDDMLNGEAMYELRQNLVGPRRWVRFLATHDTLHTRNEPFPADVALVTPLAKGQIWISGYTLDTIPWHATVIERYAFRKIDGTVYRNVVEVEYRPQTSRIQESWVRFYAEGVGPVQTVKNFNPNPEQTSNVVVQPLERTVLISTSSPQHN